MKVFIVFCLGMALSFSAFAQSEVEEGSVTAEGSAAVDESSTTTENLSIEDLINLNGPDFLEGLLDDDEVFQFAEVMPRFNGDLNKWLQKNCHYPQSALDRGVSGKVYVDFIVEPDGSVSNVKVVRGVDEDLDAEAVRVVSSMPKWSPGMQKDTLVRVKYTIPINFSSTYYLEIQKVGEQKPGTDAVEEQELPESEGLESSKKSKWSEKSKKSERAKETKKTREKRLHLM